MRKVNIEQHEEAGVKYGYILSAEDLMLIQEFAHAHSTMLARDIAMLGAAGALVSGFDFALPGNLQVSIAAGHALGVDGLSHETLPEGEAAVVVLDAAHVSLPRFDLICARLDGEAATDDQFRPFRRLLETAEIEAGQDQYPPSRFNVPTKLDTMATVVVVKGVAAGVPAAPATPAGHVALYQVRVNAGVTVLQNDKVTDVRPVFQSLAAIKALLATYGNVVTRNTGLAAGNVPLLEAGGLLNPSVLPPLAITDTFVVNSQAAMLALNAQVGDVAVRTDAHGAPSVARNYILKTSPASVLANWQELAAGSFVVSFNGRQGAIVLTAADVVAALAGQILGDMNITGNLLLGGNFSMPGDDKYFAIDHGLERNGWMKPAGGIGRIAFAVGAGAGFDFLRVDKASGVTIDPTLAGNVFTEVARFLATGFRVTGDITATQSFTLGTVKWFSGAGSPNGVITAPIGSLYTRTDGGAGSTLYVKESGSGNTGWVAK
jgi:hypothetical protein